MNITIPEYEFFSHTIHTRVITLFSKNIYFCLQQNRNRLENIDCSKLSCLLFMYAYLLSVKTSIELNSI